MTPSSRIVRTIILLAVAVASHPGGAQTPQVILISADDLALEALGCYGNKAAKTPNIDKLAAEGIVFTRAYAPSPESLLARYAMLTGGSPESLGTTQGRTELPRLQINLAHVLNYQGYSTAFFGDFGYKVEDQYDDYGFGMFYDFEDAQAEVAVRGAKEVPITVETQFRFVSLADPSHVRLNSRNLPIPSRLEDMPGTLFTAHAARLVPGRRGNRMFLWFQLLEPREHFVFPAEEKYIGLHKAEEFSAPQSGPEDEPYRPKRFKDMTPEQNLGSRAAYQTSVAALDDHVGNILRIIDEMNLTRQTLVIFTSDAGYNLGHHGWWGKRNLYEGTIRIPLIMRWPNRIEGGKKSDALTQSMDIFATIVSACGGSIWAGIEGRDLAPHFTDSTLAGRTHAVSTYSELREAAIRDDRFKLIYSSGTVERDDGYVAENPPKGRQVRLYDLQADPFELRNLAWDPQHGARIDALKAALVERLSGQVHGGTGLPQSASVEEKLDLLLIPRETWRKITSEIRDGF